MSEVVMNADAQHLRAQRVIELCLQIAAHTEIPGNITRTFLCEPMRAVHALLREEMKRLGMQVRVDAVGNLRGIHEAKRPGEGASSAARLIIGSHIDTVPDAGAYDGVLGVVLGLALVEALEGRRMEYAIEVIAFSEEEGVRFKTPFIGSRVLIGDMDGASLARKDAAGITVTQAIRSFGLDPAELPQAALDAHTFAYLELHIEQGPVLESLGLALGVVETIAGQARLSFTFTGKANHAGTTPMHLRQDALAGAAEWLVLVEQIALKTPGLVATVGQIEARPGAGNVVPGEVVLSLDIRHTVDAIRMDAMQALLQQANEIAARRGLHVRHSTTLEQKAVGMDKGLADGLAEATAASGYAAYRMHSGAGHDAMVMARKVPSAMLFLRSPGGISHHPDEAVLVEDVAAALRVGLHFLERLRVPE